MRKTILLNNIIKAVTQLRFELVFNIGEKQDTVDVIDNDTAHLDLQQIYNLPIPCVVTYTVVCTKALHQ